MTATLELTRALIELASVTPDDAGCQSVIEAKGIADGKDLLTDDQIVRTTDGEGFQPFLGSIELEYGKIMEGVRTDLSRRPGNESGLIYVLPFDHPSEKPRPASCLDLQQQYRCSTTDILSRLKFHRAQYSDDPHPPKYLIQ